MKIKQRQVDGGPERMFLTGAIVSDQFLKEASTFYDPDLLEVRHTRTVAEWCFRFFNKYGKAPGIGIKDIYETHLDRLEPTDREMIAELLAGLSEEYERADKLNVPYLLDSTEKHFKTLSLTRLTRMVNGLAANGNVEEAEAELANYKRVGRPTSLGCNPFTDAEGLQRAFEQVDAPLFTMPGKLGHMMGSVLNRDQFVALMGPEKRGKCLPGSERVLLSNGDYWPIAKIIEERRSDIISFDGKSQKFVPTKVSRFWRNGVKQVFKVTTRTGRQVRVTGNHPFLTPDGWKELSNLETGVFIAVPKCSPFFGSEPMSNEVVRLLAYFITEGCLVKSNPGFTTADPDIKTDFETCVKKLGCRVQWYGIDAEVYNAEENKGKHNKNHVRTMLERFSLMGKLCYDKHIPDEIFRLPKDQISLFLSILFTCDGWICKEGEGIGFAVANEYLARQVHHLLTRFGIVSKLTWGENNKKGCWTVSIGDWKNMALYMQKIGFLYGKQKKALLAMSRKNPIQRSFLDKIPWQVASKMLHLLRNEMGTSRQEQGRHSKSSFYHSVFTKSRSISEQIKKQLPIMRQSFSEVANRPSIISFLESDILWDKIESITFVGEMETFDLTVDRFHSFIAENVLVHNTWWLNEIAIRAAKARCNVALFQIGDMSEEQVKVRLSVRLAGKSNLNKFVGEQEIPIPDCQKNQEGSCHKCPHRSKPILPEWKLGGVQAAYQSGTRKEHVPCSECAKEHFFKGSIWYKKIVVEKPLTWRESWKINNRFLGRIKGRDFRLHVSPSNQISVSGIKGVLDNWEMFDGFIPDVIVIDYADNLAPENAREEPRHQVNRTWKMLRGLSQERHCLVVTATQAAGRSYKKTSIEMEDYSEDKRKYAHVTGMFSLNQTPEEKRMGIMRIGPIVVREDEFFIEDEVKVAQSLRTGRPLLFSF